MKSNNLKQASTPKYGDPAIAPQSLEAEEAVIGAILISEQAWDRVSFLTPEMFYNPRHQTMLEAVLSLKKKGVGVDIITALEEIRAMGKTEEVTPYDITYITSKVASDAHIVHHALYVLQTYVQRQVMYLSAEVKSQAGNPTEDIAEVLEAAGKGIGKLLEVLGSPVSESSYREIAELFYNNLNLRMARFAGQQQTGIPTGIHALDRLTCGWQGSELIILAARPSMGKTAVALHLAQCAARQGTPVIFFSLEMPKLNLFKRSMLSESDSLNAGRLQSGDLSGDFQEIDRIVGRICNLPIFVEDNAGITMANIRAKCRFLHEKGKCGMVIIDYLQLVRPEKGRYGNREQEIASISREAKLIAKELDVPVILLSQLNREVEKRQDKRPLLSDLRESGAIEQDADMVVFIHRPGYYGKMAVDRDGNEVKNAGELIIAKNRNGATGKARFRHNDSMTRIFDYDS